ncbi:MAG: M28 family peptidase [Gemmatimonadetes bacterium]|uniref:M28 family peptidase n=1 Tax=Candidatus Kutchimonas denitrificans TaxID=3056748 RepID=A0AAE4Z693_9BACT|nr:M28 family peptidase [Gemmatimonadota bacterium]NIR73783.1 M28 family peptidase [Candidatus Kutchimonas denitrificans]NIS03147.1 M28 family peptidase [Gemmatimonadota bacterium]NIT69048.1 M28 family peptidase [Gemmatimonadota bacterium]NIU54139.1 M28 family peptidase [Gemmatimonadota bacterium]
MNRKRCNWRWVSLGLVALAGCSGADGEPDRDEDQAAVAAHPRFSGQAAYELVQRQVAFGPRVPGRQGHRAMAAWLEEYLAQRADTLVVQRFTHTTVGGDAVQLLNFLARFEVSGTRPILLLSHWDTRPVSDGADDPEVRDQPVPGANDGASGTAILLELADMMSRTPPPRSLDLLLVDGEDYGDFAVGKDVFLGSRYFAANLPEGYDPEFGVLLDMVGDRNLDIYVEGNSNRLAPAVVDRVWNIAQRLGFGDVFHRSTRHTINDDHIPLNDVGIPTIDVIDFDYPGPGNRYWHTPEDTPDKVSASSLDVVGTVMTRLIYRGM